MEFPTIYIGDGENDYCPIKNILGSGDIVFPRSGFKLEKIIEEKPNAIAAHVAPWHSGKDILAVFDKKTGTF